MADAREPPEALIPQFVFESLLNQDTQGRRITLLGSIASQPALLTVERAAFSTSPTPLTTFTKSLSRISPLGDNDIYRWYLASQSPGSDTPHDLKLNLIYPATPKHVAKYTPQTTRYVTETPEVYARHVRPWIAAQRAQGRLNWVFNILEGRSEQEDVVYRSPGFGGVGGGEAAGFGADDGFLLTPDLNWDRRTLGALHLLCLVERRDKWSVRDLCKGDVPWLRGMARHLKEAVAGMYGPGTDKGGAEGLEGDQVKMYLHYQPTYHHMHIHIVATALDAGATQATGKALDLENVIATLAALPDGPDADMAHVPISYTIGENHELWSAVWAPLKRGELRG